MWIVGGKGGKHWTGSNFWGMIQKREGERGEHSLHLVAFAYEK